MSIYLVELEGFRAGKQFYIKEMCILELNGRVFDHRFVTIPAPAQIHDTTNRYIFNHIHGIPFQTHLDKTLPRIPSKSTLITHGLEKASTLQRLYPHCHVISQLNEKSLKSPISTCPLQRHGPNCALAKAKLLRKMLFGCYS